MLEDMSFDATKNKSGPIQGGTGNQTGVGTERKGEIVDKTWISALIRWAGELLLRQWVLTRGKFQMKSLSAILVTLGFRCPLRILRALRILL